MMKKRSALLLVIVGLLGGSLLTLVLMTYPGNSEPGDTGRRFAGEWYR